MKAIILAAGRQMIGGFPAALAPVRESCVLARQLIVLESIGIRDISIVVGKDSVCWKKEHRNYVRSMGYKIIENSENQLRGNSLSLRLALEEGISDFVVILDGDTFFDSVTMSQIINNKHENLLLMRHTNVFSDTGTKVLFDRDRVIGFSEYVKDLDPPWNIYGGIIKLNGIFQTLLFERLMESDDQGRFFTIALSDVMSDISASPSLHGIHGPALPGTLPLTLKGGSYAGTKKITIVRKETVKWRAKLKDEIEWLDALPSDLSDHFPRVINHGSRNGAHYYDMPYYEYPSLRRMIFSGKANYVQASSYVHEIMSFMFDHVYSKGKVRAAKSYPFEIHVNRMKKRIEDTKASSNVFAKVLKDEYLLVNGTYVRNISSLLTELEGRKYLIEKLVPDNVSMVHGDLHCDNILINDDDDQNPKFIFVDPRGLDATYNYTYDLGKVWHSFHGMYDILHEDLFDLDIDMSGSPIKIDFAYRAYPVVELYERINQANYENICGIETLQGDKNWKVRLFFAEISHFCSVMPFHLKGDEVEKLALALYVTGLILFTEFLAVYEGASEGGSLNESVFFEEISRSISSPLGIP